MSRRPSKLHDPEGYRQSVNEDNAMLLANLVFPVVVILALIFLVGRCS